MTLFCGFSGENLSIFIFYQSNFCLFLGQISLTLNNKVNDKSCLSIDDQTKNERNGYLAVYVDPYHRKVVAGSKTDNATDDTAEDQNRGHEVQKLGLYCLCVDSATFSCISHSYQMP